MKRLLLLALAVGFAACSPDIPTGPDNSTKYVEAEFDPANSVIPLPNDLVFLDANGNFDTVLHAPTTGGTDAQNEFNRDYLNLLDGFPMESTASVLFDKPIDVTSVELFSGVGGNLAVFDITANLPITTVNISVSDAPNGAQSLNISPEERLLDPWPPLRNRGGRRRQRGQGEEVRADRDRVADLGAGR